MSIITKLSIDTSLMVNSETIRDFSVKGKIGAKFTMLALQDGTLKYYNFENEVFELTQSNLVVGMAAPIYKGRIVFPSGGGTYVVKLVTHVGTTLKDGSSVISRTIEKQSSEAGITFTPATANTANYSTFPTTTSTGSVLDAVKLESIWTINNASTDAGGHGLKWHDDIGGIGFKGELLSSVFDSFWYVQAEEAIVSNPAGDGEDSALITVADTTGLSVGMELFYHKAAISPVTKAGAAVTNCVITAVDTGSGEIKFNTAVAFENTETMTLRAYGSKNIYYNTGIIIEFREALVKAPLLTKTVRLDSDGDHTPSVNITLTDTHGISGGNTVKYIGVGVNNSSANAVSTVTPDCPDPGDSTLDDDGVVVVQLAQTLRRGSVLTFLDIYN